MSTIALHLTPISRKPLEIEEMAYGELNGRVTDDVTSLTWPWKVKLVTPIHSGPNISKTAGDKESVPKDYQ